MKRATIFYLEDEVIEKLKEKKNRSAFVNECLKTSLSLTPWENKTPEEIDLEIKKLELKIKYEKELESLNGNLKSN